MTTLAQIVWDSEVFSLKEFWQEAQAAVTEMRENNFGFLIDQMFVPGPITSIKAEKPKNNTVESETDDKEVAQEGSRISIAKKKMAAKPIGDVPMDKRGGASTAASSHKWSHAQASSYDKERSTRSKGSGKKGDRKGKSGKAGAEGKGKGKYGGKGKCKVQKTVLTGLSGEILSMMAMIGDRSIQRAPP